MSISLVDFKEQAPVELKHIIQEYEGEHFRHRGKMSLWVDESKGFELNAAPGLWKVLLGPITYRRVVSPGHSGVDTHRSLLLYTGDIKKIPSKWTIKIDGVNGWVRDVVICSDNKPVFRSILLGKVDFSSYCAGTDNTFFAFHIWGFNSEAEYKYLALYKALSKDVQRELKLKERKDDEPQGKGSRLSFDLPWKVFTHMFHPTFQREIINRKSNWISDKKYKSSFAISVTPSYVLLISPDEHITLNQKDAPQLWAIHNAIKDIEAINPNLIAATPKSNILSLYKPFVVPK